MSKIKNLQAKKILNSAGNWTIQCQLTTNENQQTTASVPAGISTGKNEKKSNPINLALNNINTKIFSQVKNLDLDQEKLDEILDRGAWGSNTTLAVSAAFFKLQKVNVKYTPKLMMLIFEGEKHGNPNLTIQEFMVVFNRLQTGINFFKKTQKYLLKHDYLDTVGSEGGMSPKDLKDNDILDILTKLGAKKIALDIVGNENPPSTTAMLNIVRRYPIYSLEDPFPETKPKQWQNFFKQIKKMPNKVLIIADDLTVTNPEKIKKHANKLFNAVIIKPNQQGTITKARIALETARNLGLKTIVSHRGEETNDTWIADFAVKYKSDFVKFGGPSKGERIAKYNRLLELG